jgi:hypothetical protein
MKHVVTFSGGIGSWAAAKRVAEAEGTDNLFLLFADTNMEDEDLYRFITEAADNVGGEFVYIAEGRTPWEVFFDGRFLGNSRIDPCSKTLKRDLVDKWFTANCDPKNTTIHVGIDWSEEHRFTRLHDRRAKQGWHYNAPLLAPPYLTKTQMIAWAASEGIAPPRLYAMGFSHNNCGGFCIKAGQGHYANLLKTMPERYAYHEAKEEEIRALIGKDVSMMTDRRGDGKKKPLTMKMLRLRLEGEGEAAVDKFDIGGCGCFLDDEAA